MGKEKEKDIALDLSSNWMRALFLAEEEEGVSSTVTMKQKREGTKKHHDAVVANWR